MAKHLIMCVLIYHEKWLVKSNCTGWLATLQGFSQKQGNEKEPHRRELEQIALCLVIESRLSQLHRMHHNKWFVSVSSKHCSTLVTINHIRTGSKHSSMYVSSAVNIVKFSHDNLLICALCYMLLLFKYVIKQIISAKL